MSEATRRRHVRCVCLSSLGAPLPADVAPPPRKCSAGHAPEADRAIVCETVAKMTQMRHDNLASASIVTGRLCLRLPIGGGDSVSGFGRQEGYGRMPAPGRHRGGAAAARAYGSRCRGCACVCEVLRCSGCQGSRMNCGEG